MTTEDRLRRAITDRTDHVVPAPGGLNAIEETLMQPTPMSPRNKWMMGGAAAVVVALVAVAAIALTKDDNSSQGLATDPAVTTTVDPQVTVTTAPPPGTETATPPTTEPTPTTSATSPPPPVVSSSSVVWPRPGHDARFDEPVDAARSFAVFYAGFTDPVVGSFTEGNVYPDEAIRPYEPDIARYGSVEVRPDTDPSSPITTVQIRQMADDYWYVISATTPDIVIDELGPKSNGVIDCPGIVRVAGSALAFEGNVATRIDSFGPDGSRTEIGRGFGTGAGTPPAAPFHADVDCEAPPERWRASDTGGVVMVWEDSARDGVRLAVTARPVSFIP